MNGWIIAAIIAAVVIMPPMVLAWAICKAASDADDRMEEW